MKHTLAIAVALLFALAACTTIERDTSATGSTTPSMQADSAATAPWDPNARYRQPGQHRELGGM